MDAVIQFLDVLVTVYLLTIFLYVITSWFRVPYSLQPVQRFLNDVCEPYLRLWRRILPLRFGPIDLTPMVAIFALIIGWQVLKGVLVRLD
jgi:YggT family protein